MARKHRQSPATRLEIATTAARMIVDGTAGDFEGAKRKAARELGLNSRRHLPDNLELHTAVADHLALFHGEYHESRTLRLRKAALEAMELFGCFNPRLTGPVLYGTACDHSAINLHLFSAELEAVTRFLLEHRIHYDLCESPFRFSRTDRAHNIPVFRLITSELIELAVFPNEGATRHPLSPIDGKPMYRIGKAALEGVIQSGKVFNMGRSSPSRADIS
jgi:hypothetical protein